MSVRTEPGPAHEDLGDCLEAMARLWRASLRRQRPRLPGEHIDLLHLVAADTPVTVASLGRSLQVSPEAVVRAVDRLRSAGLLSCSEAVEPEQVRCHMTSDGRRFLRRLRTSQCRHAAVALRRLSPRARRAAAEFISELTATLSPGSARLAGEPKS